MQTSISGSFRIKGGGAYDLAHVIGMWLKELGFDIGDYISVTCEGGRLVITPDAERAAVKAAEAEFMEREMKALQKRYEAEKVKIQAQMVAEPGARKHVYHGRVTGNRP